MKPFFFWICSVFLSINGAAQGILKVEKLNRDGITLAHKWKFQEGDNPAWAATDFDDSKWISIDPTKDIHALPELRPGVIGWFRLRFMLDSLEERELSIITQISGATEIYLDGKQIHHFGVISNDPKKIIAYDPFFKPVSFNVANQRQHVIAVRYVLQPELRYTTMFETRNSAIQIRLLRLNDAIDTFQFFTSTIVGMLLIIIGTCLLLAILHFAFYLFYPSQKGNRSFAIYALMFLLFNIVQYHFFLHGHLVSFKFYEANLAMDIRLASNIFLLTALYNILDRSKDRVYWCLIILSFICLFLNVWPYDEGWKIGALMEVLIGAAVTRIAYMAALKGKRGAWIILGGTISYFVFFTAFFTYIFLPNQAFLLNLSLPRIIMYVLSFLSIPLATSIFLGLDFAFTNLSLNEKLKEIENLSAKNIRQEKEKQEILEAQKETLEIQVQERTNALSQSLNELKSTQTQLIQSEKMASLGELTAGIAHEIQNPLNFVNNFSEVSSELLDEMKTELDKGDISEAKAIATDVIQNLEKINYHGKRADAIVKGMLQHSRSSTGKKEPTDLNALCDEYLRLSYHGLRAKDKSFNATIKTDFDESIGKINIIPQDFGRVILNLLTNAFYAVKERLKQNQSDIGYEPIVSISTKKENDKIIISVSDNGNGMPLEIVDKIFQPFFTTKPTGEGTGLGLSMSYDIITKSHNGELKVASKENKGSIFTIQIPF